MSKKQAQVTAANDAINSTVTSRDGSNAHLVQDQCGIVCSIHVLAPHPAEPASHVTDGCEGLMTVRERWLYVVNGFQQQSHHKARRPKRCGGTSVVQGSEPSRHRPADEGDTPRYIFYNQAVKAMGVQAIISKAPEAETENLLSPNIADCGRLR